VGDGVELDEFQKKMLVYSVGILTVAQYVISRALTRCKQLLE
jgi:hypothetical protein